jgi:DNA-binding MarR family transcriptional regulator
MPPSIDIVNYKDLPLAEQIFEHIHALMHLHRSQLLQSLREGEHDLTHMEGKALGFFARHPGATQSDLAQHARRDKAQIARLIGGLKDKRLLAVRPDVQDRRNQRLELTPVGQALHETLRAQGRKLARLGLASLSAEEGQQLRELLAKMRSRLEAEADRLS